MDNRDHSLKLNQLHDLLKISVHHTPRSSDDFLVISAIFLFTSVSMNSNSWRPMKWLSVELRLHGETFFFFNRNHLPLPDDSPKHSPSFWAANDKMVHVQTGRIRSACFGSEVGGASEWCHIGIHAAGSVLNLFLTMTYLNWVLALSFVSYWEVLPVSLNNTMAGW